MSLNEQNILGSITPESVGNMAKPEIVDKTKENMLGFIGIKWVAMIYVAVIQIVSCLVLSKIINKIVPPIKKKDPTKKEIDNYDEHIHKTILYII